MATPPGMRRTRKISVARASPKPAETSPMSVETCTTPADKNSARKPLQEHSRSCRASGARPAGSLTRPHGKAFATEREERPISRLQHLGEPDRYTHTCSGATVGDSHEGPLKNRGGLLLKTCKKHKTQTHLEPNAKHMHIHTAQPTPRWPSRPTRAAQQGAPSSKVRLARGLTPPSSGVRFARGSLPSSSGVRLARGLTLPRAGSASLEGPRLPRAGSASLEVPPRAHLLPHAGMGL
jgi:hypothetical protein